MTPSRLLDIVMRRRLEPPQLRLFQDGRELNPGEYLRTQTNRRRQDIRLVDAEALGGLLDAGVTLVLDAVETFDPALEVATRALRWWSREVVQVNAYLTTGPASGFPLHWDDHDVIVVQLAGEKTWDVRGSSRPFPMYRDAAPNTVPSEEAVWRGVLTPGDVLHVPRGYWHQASHADRPGPLSLHLTFGFVKRTGVDWLAWVADQARELEIFRRDLTRADSAEERETERARLAEAAAELLRSRPPELFLTNRERSRPPARHAPALPSVAGPDAVVCVTEFAPDVERDGANLVVYGGGKKITVREKAEPALALLLSGRPVDLEKASAEHGTDIRPLARVLVREGICIGLTDELSSAYTGLVTPEASWRLP
ncbi:cupin [Frankia sp. CN6]|uniref:Cupin n=2 Tax=Frankia nepalensis TaxID=1836974 RepID=A0A937RJM7_9ACTN|nr:cupin [Frankia nepalensis]